MVTSKSDQLRFKMQFLVFNQDHSVRYKTTGVVYFEPGLSFRF